MEVIQNIDNTIIVWIQEHMVQKWLNPWMLLVSKLGNGGFVWIAIGVFLLVLGWKKKERLWQGLSILLCLASNAVVCNIWLKPMVARIRPYDLLGFDILVPPLSDYSFPSGHTSASFAAATAIYAINRKWGIVAYAFSVWMGISRMYLGVHFPTDVICGAVIGIIMSKLTLFLLKKSMKNKNKSSIL